MANYAVKTKILHNLDGPSELSITATGDWKVLKEIENYALNYEKYLEIQKELDQLRAELKALSGGR